LSIAGADPYDVLAIAEWTAADDMVDQAQAALETIVAHLDWLLGLKL